MSTPPSIQRFYAEDYRDAPSWFKGKFLNTLNLFAFPTYTALAGNLDATNLNIEYYTFSMIGGVAATNNVVTFTPTINGTPHGVTIMQAQVTGTPTPVYLTSAPAVASWTWNGSQITIQSITGLDNGTAYQITVKVE